MNLHVSLREKKHTGSEYNDIEKSKINALNIKKVIFQTKIC